MYSSAMLWLASFPVFVRRTSSLDRASAMLSCPGVYVMVYSNACNLNTHLSIRADGFDLHPYRTASGRQSVMSRNIVPSKYMLNRSQAHTIPSVSFSVWLYRVSTSVRIPLAYAMKTNSPFCFCTSTAPNPTGLASVITCVSVSLSK